MLARDAQQVLLGELHDAVPEALQEVLGQPVVLERHEPSDDQPGVGEREDEGIEERVLRELELVVRNRLLPQPLHVVQHTGQGLVRGRAFGQRIEDEGAGPQVPGHQPAPDGVGQTLTAPHVLEEPRGEGIPSQDVPEQSQCEEVRVVFLHREIPDAEVGLREVPAQDVH